MTGFEPRTSGVGSNRSTNWATTTAPKTRFLHWPIPAQSLRNILCVMLCFNSWDIHQKKYHCMSDVFIELLCFCWMINNFTSLVKSKSVKQEVVQWICFNIPWPPRLVQLEHQKFIFMLTIIDFDELLLSTVRWFIFHFCHLLQSNRQELSTILAGK